MRGCQNSSIWYNKNKKIDINKSFEYQELLKKTKEVQIIAVYYSGSNLQKYKI